MKSTAVVIFILLSIIFFGCEKDDNTPSQALPPASNNSNWSFTATVNGHNVHADSVIAGLSIDTSFGFPFRALILSAICDTLAILPGFSDTINSTTPAIGNYDSDGIMDYHCMSDTINSYFTFGAHFSITAIDVSAQKVSGTFSGTVVGDVTGNTVVITNGVFTNIHYEVVWY